MDPENETTLDELEPAAAPAETPAAPEAQASAPQPHEGSVRMSIETATGAFRDALLDELRSVGASLPDLSADVEAISRETAIAAATGNQDGLATAARTADVLDERMRVRLQRTELVGLAQAVRWGFAILRSAARYGALVPAVLALLALSSCGLLDQTPPGQLKASKVGPSMHAIIARHDRYVRADPALDENTRKLDLIESDQVGKAIDEAQAAEAALAASSGAVGLSARAAAGAGTIPRQAIRRHEPAP